MNIIGGDLLHRTTIDALVDALHVIDRDYNILLVNERFRQWCLALDLPTDLVGKSVGEAFPFLGEDVEEQYRAVFETGQAHMSVEETTFDGESIITETRKVPVWEDGEVSRVITLVRDITEYRRVQVQLHHSRKMDALGQLAGGIAHDFNNVLTTIMGCAQMLQRLEPSLTKKGRKNLETILQASEYSVELVAKLLRFGKMKSLSRERVSVNSVIEDVIAMVEGSIGKGTKVSFCRRAEPDWISGDSSALQNAFLNLAINSIAAMPDGGKLAFETRNVVLDEGNPKTSLRHLGAGPYVEIKVRDTGVGIPADVQDKIFDPFFTTRKDGSGLGLATVYSTVRELGGAIYLESESGTGTAFFVSLPLRPSDISNK